MIGRRQFVTLLGGAAVAWPLAASAQQPKSAAKTWRIGFLQPSGRQETLLELRSGLRDLGYTEGQNIVLESRVVQDANHDALIAELLGLKIDVLVTWTTPLALASKRAAPALPIVAITGDPVGTRLVESLPWRQGCTNALGKIGRAIGRARGLIDQGPPPQLVERKQRVDPAGVVEVAVYQPIEEMTDVEVRPAALA